MEKVEFLNALDFNNLAHSVTEVLEALLEPIKIKVKSNGLHEDKTLQCLRLQLELSGEPLDKIAAEFGKDGKMELNWLLPKEEGHYSLAGEKWVSPYRFKIKQEDEKESKLKSAPNLDTGAVFSRCWRDADRLWKQFAESIEKDVSLESFIRLEAGLNALWTSGLRRNSLLAKVTDENPLLKIEQARQVCIDIKGAEIHGRLRLPHESHKYRLCPFQTPESKRTGLDMQLAADAEVDRDGKIKQSKRNYLFSVAVGMVPYPFHTDGPRLMMGGKNMKQAETGIKGGEPSIVPGYFEGYRAYFIPAIKDNTDNEGRLKPYIGLNALTVIMPYEGYTYEDGLVVSQSLAERLSIIDGKYSVPKVYTFLALQGDNCNLTIPELQEKIKESIKLKDYNYYVYGEELPYPEFEFFEMKDDKLMPFEFGRNINDIYAHHVPGTITIDDIDVKIEKSRTKGTLENRRSDVSLTLKWNFKVERPLALGDKLTGRHGNKGVVTCILDDDDMPEVAIGGEVHKAELIISPSSIMGRKNLGQIWEMTHSVLFKKGIDDIPSDDEMTEENKENLKGLLSSIGADESGTFPVTVKIRDVTKKIRAFAGWQYFCRLHHHSGKKLQGRSWDGPTQEATGQPAVCSARTGQRLGEMENWSMLSHGAEGIFFNMRKKHTGRLYDTKKLMLKIYNSLNLDFNLENSDIAPLAEIFGDEPEFKAVKRTSAIETEKISFQELFKKDFDSVKYESYDVYFSKKLLNKESSADESFQPEYSYLSTAEKLKELEEEANKTEKKKVNIKPIMEMLDEQDNLHVEAELLSLFPDLKRALQEFFYSKSYPKDSIDALKNYRKGLIKLLSSKMGLPRRYLLGRRYNHSGRAVIVPRPELKPNEVYLPLSMLVELLDGYGERYEDFFSKSFQEVRASVNDPKRKAWNEAEAKRCEEKLQNEKHELWAFLVRQPSLHRHSIQSFKVRCWNEQVIGLPPFVTPGFNADFDGDTMAVFLPDESNTEPMGKFSILENPGLVGDGSSAFSASLDLALGWWNMDKQKKQFWYKRAKCTKEKPAKLKDYMPQLLKVLGSESFDERARQLGELQLDICSASTGAASLTPLEFDELNKHLEDMYPEKNKDNDKNAENAIKDFFKKYDNLGIAKMVNSGAKGSEKDVRQMTWAIGEIDKFQEASEKPYIKGCFWKGLSEDEMFLYSYPSRDSMAQKKLSVAEAGYLSRQFAEGLYEIRVTGEDCKCNNGIKIGCSDGRDHLTLELNGHSFEMPTLGDLEKDLERTAWGRTLVSDIKGECLSSEDLKTVIIFWKNGDTSGLKPELKKHLEENDECLFLRSPLFCEEKNEEGVCSRCCGADTALKLFDKPKPVEIDSCIGLTAAQAIGERGTQLAMKRFHDVAGGKTEQVAENSDTEKEKNKIAKLRELFIYNKNDKELKDRFKDLLEILAKDKEPDKADVELPQALIHFETALRLQTGLDENASKHEGRYLSALAHERIQDLLHCNETEVFTDNLRTLKSRILWK